MALMRMALFAKKTVTLLLGSKSFLKMVVAALSREVIETKIQRQRIKVYKVCIYLHIASYHTS
jgi:hypothetical protein